MSTRMLSRSFLLLAIIVLVQAVLAAAMPGSLAEPAVVLRRTALREAQFSQGLAGMMAEYLPEDGKVYLLGGYKRSGNDRVLSDEVWRYDPALDELMLIGKLPYGLALAAHVYVPDRGLIFLFGGLDAGGVSDAIRTYNPVTGELSTLPNRLPAARARASAVFTGTTIFIAGGVAGDNPIAAPPFNELLHFSINSDRVVGSFDLPADWGDISNPNQWVAAFYLAESYLPVQKPAPPDQQPPATTRHVLILGTHGYAVFNPNTGAFLEQRRTEVMRGWAAGASVYAPTQTQIWSAGGFGVFGDFSAPFVCSDFGISLVDPVRESITDLADIPLPAASGGLADTQNDGAAVYVPDIDRVLVFGGFRTTDSSGAGLCQRPWSSNPAANQYSNRIYSLSPQYFDEYDLSDQSETGSSLIPIEVLNAVAGQPVQMQVFRQDAGEPFAVALQGPFRSSDGSDHLQMRVLTATLGGANPNQPSVIVTLPQDISPAAARRVMAFCIFSLARTMPANCREAAITTQPASLQGVVVADMSGAGLGGEQPLGGATVELRDIDGALVATTLTAADGSYRFCTPGQHCLAVEQYSVDVIVPFDITKDYLHLPTSRGVALEAATTASMDIVVLTTKILGPTIERLEAEFDGMVGDDIGTFMAMQNLPGVDIPEVNNELRVITKDFYPLLPTSKVRFEFPGATWGWVDSNGSDGWSAEFDMSVVLKPGENILKVTAYDNSPQQRAGEPRYFTIHAIAAKSYSAPWLTGPAQVWWSPLGKVYTAHIIVPNQPRLRWPDNPPQQVDLVVGRFYNQFRADFNVYESFHIDGNWTGRGDGAFLAQFMAQDPTDINLFDERIDVKPIYTAQANGSVPARQISVYKVSRNFDLCKLGLPECDEWIQTPAELGKKVKVPRTDREVELRLGVDFKYAGSFYVEGHFSAQDFRPVFIRVTPHPVLSSRLAATAALEVIEGVLGLELGLAIEGEIQYDQPIDFSLVADPPIRLLTPCIAWAPYARLWASIEVAGLTAWEAEWLEKLLEIRIPPGCTYSPEQLAGLMQPSYQTPDWQPAPAAATSPGGDVMTLWVDDANTSPDVTDEVLRYRYDAAAGDDASGILANSVSVHDPAIAFLDADTALAVWAQVDSMGGPADTLDTWLNKQEVYWARWQKNSGWEPPQRLTTNTTVDGQPVIAAYNASEAMVVWQRDMDGNSGTTGDWRLLWRRWNGSAWSAEQVASNQPGVIDLEPALAYSQGGVAWLVWSRDPDADFATDDRRLVYATNSGAGWSAVQQPAAWPARSRQASLAFSPLSDKPLVAMVVAPDGSNRIAAANISIGKRLYAAWWGAGAGDWDVQAIGETRGSKPLATLYTDRHAMIILRGFGGGDADGAPSAGQIVVAAGALLDNGQRWAPPGAVTAASETVWQIAGATFPNPNNANHPVANGKMEFIAVQEAFPETAEVAAAAQTWVEGSLAPVQMVGHRIAMALGGNDNTGVFGFGDGMNGIDPLIEEITPSNPFPGTGELVTLSVRLRNTELRPMGSTGNQTLRVRLICPEDRGCGTLDIAEYNGEMLFNEALTFELEYISTGKPEPLVIVLDNNPNDLDTTNNRTDYVMGAEIIPAPSAVQAADLGPGELLVGWLPPDENANGYRNGTGQPLFYRVFRSTAAEGPWTLIGLSPATTFYDRLAEINTTAYHYAVQAFDARNRRSPLSMEAPQTPPAYPTYLPAVVR